MKKANQNKASALRRILSYVSTYKVYTVLSILCAVVYVVASLYIPIVCGNAVDLMLGEGAVDTDALLNCAVEVGVLALLGGLFFFLCDAASSFITGVVLPIDGGFSAYSGV